MQTNELWSTCIDLLWVAKPLKLVPTSVIPTKVHASPENLHQIATSIWLGLYEIIMTWTGNPKVIKHHKNQNDLKNSNNKN